MRTVARRSGACAVGTLCLRNARRRLPPCGSAPATDRSSPIPATRTRAPAHTPRPLSSALTQNVYAALCANQPPTSHARVKTLAGCRSPCNTSKANHSFAHIDGATCLKSGGSYNNEQQMAAWLQHGTCRCTAHRFTRLARPLPAWSSGEQATRVCVHAWSGGVSLPRNQEEPKPLMGNTVYC